MGVKPTLPREAKILIPEAVCVFGTGEGCSADTVPVFISHGGFTRQHLPVALIYPKAYACVGARRWQSLQKGRDGPPKATLHLLVGQRARSPLNPRRARRIPSRGLGKPQGFGSGKEGWARKSFGSPSWVSVKQASGG